MQGTNNHFLGIYFNRKVLESSPDAVVTVTSVRPFRPFFGTVVVIVVSFFIVKAASWPGPKEMLRRHSDEPNFVPLIVILSPALPSSGESFTIFGASPKQALPLFAVSALLYVGLPAFGLAAFGSPLA